MYGDIRSTKKIYIQDLAEDIKTHGVVEALSVDRKTNQIERGHHRYVALELNGYTKAPVIYVNSPKNRYKKKLKMMSSNMRSPLNPAEKFELIKGLIEEYYKEYEEVPSSKLERQFCSSVQTTPSYYKMSKELKKERPDLFDKVKDGKMAFGRLKKKRYHGTMAKFGSYVLMRGTSADAPSSEGAHSELPPPAAANDGRRDPNRRAFH